MTGVKPKLPEEIVQKEYEYYCTVREKGENYPWFAMYAIEELYEITGIKPEIREDIVQKAYANLVYEWSDYCRASGIGYRDNYPKIKKLEELTGIKPKLSEEFVQARYVISRLNIHYTEKLEKITGIKPSKETIEKVKDLRYKDLRYEEED